MPVAVNKPGKILSVSKDAHDYAGRLLPELGQRASLDQLAVSARVLAAAGTVDHLDQARRRQKQYQRKIADKEEKPDCNEVLPVVPDLHETLLDVAAAETAIPQLGMAICSSTAVSLRELQQWEHQLPPAQSMSGPEVAAKYVDAATKQSGGEEIQLQSL